MSTCDLSVENQFQLGVTFCFGGWEEGGRKARCTFSGEKRRRGEEGGIVSFVLCGNTRQPLPAKKFGGHKCCGKAWRHGSRDAKPQSSTSNSIATSKLLNWFDRHVEVLACTTAHWEAGQLVGPSGHGGGVRTWSGGFGACVSVMEWTDWESCREFLSNTDVFSGTGILS